MAEPTEPKIEKPVSIETRFSDLRMWADTIDHYQKTHELTEEQKNIIGRGVFEASNTLLALSFEVSSWNRNK